MTFKRILTTLGPGLLYAGAAIGVSHLVQSTRAGAEFGFRMLWVVIIINIIKYPVFEVGARYAAATGTNLLDGYKKIGNWAVWTYVGMNILTMFIVMAAISIVTSGLFIQLTGLQASPPMVAILLTLASAAILGIGQYNALDKLMKTVVLLLTLSTLFALAFSLAEPATQPATPKTTFDFSNRENMLFLVALIGWMPAPVDITIWYSVWATSGKKEEYQRPALKNTLIDFHIGYWGTTLMAAVFVALGALIMYGSGEELANGSVEFSGQLIRLYTQNLGQWAFPFIALAAFTTMFSTLITCLDGFPRTLRSSTTLLMPRWQEAKHHGSIYWFWMALTCVGSTVILLFFLPDMRAMVDLATTVSFVLAPVFAILNYMAINHADVDPAHRQPRWLSMANVVSILALTGFSIWFLLY